MNVVRTVVSAFMLILLALCVAGWIWARGLPSPKMEGARLVLALCGCMSVGAMGLIWTFKRPPID